MFDTTPFGRKLNSTIFLGGDGGPRRWERLRRTERTRWKRLRQSRRRQEWCGVPAASEHGPCDHLSNHPAVPAAAAAAGRSDAIERASRCLPERGSLDPRLLRNLAADRLRAAHLAAGVHRLLERVRPAASPTPSAQSVMKASPRWMASASAVNRPVASCSTRPGRSAKGARLPLVPETRMRMASAPAWG